MLNGRSSNSNKKHFNISITLSHKSRNNVTFLLNIHIPSVMMANPWPRRLRLQRISSSFVSAKHLFVVSAKRSFGWEKFQYPYLSSCVVAQARHLQQTLFVSILLPGRNVPETNIWKDTGELFVSERLSWIKWNNDKASMRMLNQRVHHSILQIEFTHLCLISLINLQQIS